ncbi:MAG: hypothetical protein M3M88_05525 [Thermoproteota archaeon]|nr:hypothetical protein [Thermoproteota archaeon]
MAGGGQCRRYVLNQPNALADEWNLYTSPTYTFDVLFSKISFPPIPFPSALFLNEDSIDGHYTIPLSPSGPKGDWEFSKAQLFGVYSIPLFLCVHTAVGIAAGHLSHHCI